ncbi:hypothetical protein B0H14DRAFT_2605122 [Mycena olivaceomarginata]|nr:hypothetical protein B0H14DRAFT_2605122 [Mycena olivaceomarginata]
MTDEYHGMQTNSRSTHAPRGDVTNIVSVTDQKQMTNNRNFFLPTLALVRADAARARVMRRDPQHYEDIPFVFPSGSPANQEPPLPMHLKLALNTRLSNLSWFSYMVCIEDVPEDIVDDCIWALAAQFILLMEECTEAVLTAVRQVIEGNDYKQTKTVTLINARAKIILHLIGADRAAEAIPYSKAMVDDNGAGSSREYTTFHTPFGGLTLTRSPAPWLKNPYASSLIPTESRQHIQVAFRGLWRDTSPDSS